MFVTRGSKNSLFSVFDFLSNLDCGQWYKFWICQSLAIGDSTCNACHQLQHTQVFISKTTGKEYKIFCNFNCKTPNVVYLLDCHVCGSQYVGESVQQFNKRMNGHRSDFMKKNALVRESTLCVAGALIGRLWQIQNLYHWPQSKLER
jgi:hypothetical protein